METLQKIINNKAEAKLKKELDELDQFLYNKYYKIFDRANIRLNIGTSETPKSIDIKYIFSDSNYKKELFTANIDAYTEAETKLFLAEIEELKHKTDELFNNI